MSKLPSGTITLMRFYTKSPSKDFTRGFTVYSIFQYYNILDLSWVAFWELIFVITYVMSNAFNYLVIKTHLVTKELDQLKLAIDLLVF